MRVVLGLLCSLLIHGVWANMASPMQWGTYSASPFIHEHVNILSEELSFKIDSCFSTAHVEVVYNIQAEEDTLFVPLLFIAMDYEGDFKVWVDDKEVESQEFSGYGIDIFDYQLEPDEEKRVEVQFEEDYKELVLLSDCMFFTTPITAGKHQIKVSYTARVWEDLSGWVTHKSFRYSLSPARAWKSFGKLTINIDASAYQDSLKVDVNQKVFQGKSTLEFESIPQDLIIISNTPKIPPTASFLINLSPYGIMWIACILLTLLHLFILTKIRNTKKKLSYKGAVVLGGFIVIFLSFLSFMYAYPFIDYIIGKHASHYHGYSFLIFFYYPFIVPAYALVVGIIDWFIIKRLSHGK